MLLLPSDLGEKTTVGGGRRTGTPTVYEKSERILTLLEGGRGAFCFRPPQKKRGKEPWKGGERGKRDSQ